MTLRKALKTAIFSRLIVVSILLIASIPAGFFSKMYVEDYIQYNVTPFSQFDSKFYTTIAINGYPNIANPVGIEWAFFPLYPFVLRILSQPFISTSTDAPLIVNIIGAIVSNLAFVASSYFMYKLTYNLFKNDEVATLSTVFYSFAFGSVFFSTVYTESLFMLLMLSSFYYLETDRLSYAIALGFLASFTRSNGFLIAIPFIILALQRYKNAKQFAKLFSSSIIVASPFLIFQAYGYVVAGHMFPITIISRDLIWGKYPNLFQQMFSVGVNPIVSQFQISSTAYFSLLMIYDTIIILPLLFLIALPVYYCHRDVFTKVRRRFYNFEWYIHKALNSTTLKYWVFFVVAVFQILFISYIFSAVRYALLLLPIYWFLAKISVDKPNIRKHLLNISIILMIVGSLLFEFAIGLC